MDTNSDKLTAENLDEILEAEKSVQSGDLYRYLKLVGDDSTKSEIEWALKQVLNDATFRTVVAVFKIATSD